MTVDRELDSLIVLDAAAYLFWTLAESTGVMAASDSVITSSGRCLMEMPFTAEVLGRYGLHELSLSEQREYGVAIAAEAERHAVQERNMTGAIYAEDAQSGRSPSAQKVQTQHLAVVPRRIEMSGAKLEKLGRLCLRHPLPAVVFSNKVPRQGIFEVANTSVALGFQLPMFFTCESVAEFDERLFAFRGVFQIPTPNLKQGEEWRRVIQNAMCFMGGTKFYGNAGITTVVVEW